MSKCMKTVLCVVLVVSVLAMSISVFADNPAEPSPPPGYEDILVQSDLQESMISYYIYRCMRAWGIDIEYNDSVEFTQEISDLIIDWVFEFLDTLPSAYTISTWIAPWQAGFDYWGNLRLNGSALEDIQDFVEWLEVKMGLFDEAFIPINPVYNVGDYTLYQFSHYYQCIGINGESQYWQLELQYSTGNSGQYGTPDGYFIWINTLNNHPWFVVVSGSSYKIQVLERLYGANGWEGAGGGVLTSSIRSNGSLHYAKLAESFGCYLPNGAQVFSGSESELNNFMATAAITQSGDMQFVTSEITLPDDDSGYTTGDSITIINTEPSYQVIQWSDEITVSNLPAVVSTGTVSNPGLIEFFRPVSAFVAMAKDSMDLMIQIVYRLPVEVNVCIYAVMGSIVLLGVIKLMREH